MKLAISNIAWSPSDDEAVAARMREHGFSGVEIAPTKYWPAPLSVGPAEVAAVRRFWERRGIAVVALQSLLFGTSGLAVFGTPAQRQATLQYLQGIVRLGGQLGAGVVVFGSPRNRSARGREPAEVDAEALEFFRALGDVAAETGLVFCIEPNPPAYGCDWITTSAEGRSFVNRIGHPGLGLHLDAAGMALAGEDPARAIAAAGDAIRHFHASEPELAALGGGAIDHGACAAALRAVGYRRWVSVEMRAAGDGSDLSRAAAAMALIARAATTADWALPAAERPAE